MIQLFDEVEFKALLQVAPYDLQFVAKICYTLEQALRNHPEWARHLFKNKSVKANYRWQQRGRKHRFHFLG